MTRPMRSNKSNDADKWLNDYTAHVDYQRLKRGVELFHDNAVEHFQWTSSGFRANVEGTNHTLYLTHGDLHLKNKFPDLQLYEVQCSCKDQARYCPHAVCVTLYVIIMLDKFIDKAQQDATIHLEYKDKRIIKRVEELVRKSKVSIDSLEDVEDSFEAHHPFNDVMTTIHEKVKRQYD